MLESNLLYKFLTVFLFHDIPGSVRQAILLTRFALLYWDKRKKKIFFCQSAIIFFGGSSHFSRVIVKGETNEILILALSCTCIHLIIEKYKLTFFF